MGLWRNLRQLVNRFRSSTATRLDADEFRRCRFETMEQRRLLDADPIRIGAVYVEEDGGADLHGDTFEITFEGGAAATQLTRVVISGDQDAPGFGTGDVFFDTTTGGLGADVGQPFHVISLTTQNPQATVSAAVLDGTNTLTLDFTGFQAGDKLVFSIDVDEVEDYDPAETNLQRINDGFDPITSGVEFQSSRITATFSAPHYHDIDGSSTFRNHYDELFAGSGLNLPADDFQGKRDRSDGAIVQLQQTPLPISISGKVYLEKDLDLVTDPGETGLSNVELSLWIKDGSSYRATGHTTRTATDGTYEFGTDLNLLPGVYQVREVQPAGLFSVGAIPGTVEGVISGATVEADRNVLTEITIPLGGTHSVNNDFAEAEPARLNGYVYHDRSDDGVRNSGEEGLSGVTIQVIPVETIASQPVLTATTDAQGFYQVTGLAPGTYHVVEVAQPSGYFDGRDTIGTVLGSPVGRAVNPGDNLEEIVLLGGQAGNDYNFGELAPVSIAGRVGLTDPDGNCENLEARPISGAVVRLLDTQGKLLAETKTNAQGAYQFTGLRPGEYTVEELTPAGLIDGDAHPGTVGGQTRGTAGEGRISQVVLGSGQQGVRYDFCEHEPSSISGVVYHDQNNNGRRDAGEDPIADTTVTLRDAVGTVTGVQRTNGAGFYEFTGLAAGTYSIQETQPSGWLDGQDAAGTIDGEQVGIADNPGDRISEVSLRWGEDSLNNDFGELLAGSIAGQVHLDTNGNCLLDDGELPLAGVTIELLDAHGQVLRTQTTDADGRYSFSGLEPGEYGVRELQPEGVFHGGQTAGSHGGLDGFPDLITDIQVGSGQDLVDYNFCEVPPATLSGLVFADPNHDCQYNEGDSALAGVEIELLDDFGEVVATTVTGEDGRYRFENLAPGMYSVRELQPDGYFQGGQSAGSGGGDVFEADVISHILVNAGEDLVEYNFCEVPPASLSGMVYVDPNQDCQFNTGDVPLSGVTVQLLDEIGSVVATAVTGADGRYRFANLAPGAYSVRELQPTGFFNGGEVPGSGGGDVSAPNEITSILIAGGEDLVRYDFCEVPPAKISGHVFQDGAPIRSTTGNLTPQQIGQLRDGQFTEDDTPISGVTLQLRDGFTGEAIDASEAIPGRYSPGAITVQTDASGYYEFTGIPGGRSYAIYQIHPTEFVDGIDTVGTTTGFAFNSQSLDEQSALEPLAGQPASDAIIRIAVAPGGASEDNNFSEVQVDTQVIPPVTPPPLVIFPPPATFIPAIIQPAVTTQTRQEPMLSMVTWVAPRQSATVETVGAAIGYTWHLSVINGGLPRDLAKDAPADEAVWQSARHVNQVPWGPDGVDQARWVLAASQAEKGTPATRTLVFGIRGGFPIAGDFNGDGLSEVGVFYRGEWFVDLNGNGVWDESDLWAKLGDELDRPVVGDWDGDGKDDIGIYGPEWFGDQRQIDRERGLPDSQNLHVVEETTTPKNVPPATEEATDGQRLLQLGAKGPRRSDVIDHVLRYGEESHAPVAGDWNGDGIRTIGVFHGGEWRVDQDGDGILEKTDPLFRFGTVGDIPVVGDWNGDGIEEIGVYRQGRWILDVNGNRELDVHDKVFEMGGAVDRPVVGDWNGDGVDDPGLYREQPPGGEVPVRT